MDKVRWGIVGIGGIARRRVVPEVLRYGRNADVVAVTGRDPDRTRDLAAEFGVDRWTTDLSELLADPAVEAVYVGTPNHLHRPQVIAAARAKKAVLCEKPLGLDVAESEEMVRVCREESVSLGVGFMMRHHALHREAARRVRKGAVGRPVFARAQLMCWYPAIEGAWRQDPALGGGGSLVDLGSHCIDLLERILGSRVREVTAFQASLVQRYPVEDIAVSLLRFENGAMATVDNGFNVPDAAAPNRLEVYGTAGGLLAEGTIGQEPGGVMRYCASPQDAYEAQQARAVEATSGWVEVDVTPRAPLYAAEIDAFSASVRRGTPPEIDGDAGLWNAKVIAACYESARTGRTVAVA